MKRIKGRKKEKQTVGKKEGREGRKVSAKVQSYITTAHKLIIKTSVAI
jgi:hypothetical protein